MTGLGWTGCEGGRERFKISDSRLKKVKPDTDMKKGDDKKSQEALILKALRRGRRLTHLDAGREFDCLRLGARVCDLRKLRKIPVESKMVRLPSGKRVAEYFLPRKRKKKKEGAQ